jgi:hypothetical protein
VKTAFVSEFLATVFGEVDIHFLSFPAEFPATGKIVAVGTTTGLGAAAGAARPPRGPLPPAPRPPRAPPRLQAPRLPRAAGPPRSRRADGFKPAEGVALAVPAVALVFALAFFAVAPVDFFACDLLIESSTGTSPTSVSLPSPSCVRLLGLFSS